LLGDGSDAAREIRNRIELAEHREILADRQPVRHVDKRTLEVHFMQHLVALSGHLGAKHPHRAGGRHHEPENHREGGGLAGAVAAEQPGDRACLQHE
jgi:hypothetical protein